MKPERLTLRDWGRDIHDLCALANDLKAAPALMIEASICDLCAAMANLAEEIYFAQLRILNRQ